MNRKHTLFALAASALVLASCTTASTSAGTGTPQSDVQPMTIDSMFVIGVVEVAIQNVASSKIGENDVSPVDATIEAHLYDAGDIYWVDGSGPHREPLPAVGATVRFIAPQWVAETIEPGRLYSLAIERPFSLGTVEEFPWNVRYAFDSEGRLLGPEYKAMGIVSQEVKVLRLGAESELEGALGFLSERQATLNATNRGLESRLGQRESLLASSREAPSASVDADSVAAWISLPETDRQLPHDVSTNLNVSNRQAEALGLTEWHAWTLVVVYDSDVEPPGGWAGLQIEGYGFLGPTLLDRGQTIALATGFGPDSAPVHFIEWPSGEPITRSGGPGDVPATHHEDQRLDASEISRTEMGESGAILVDLRHGINISAIDQQELIEILEQNSVPTTPGPES